MKKRATMNHIYRLVWSQISNTWVAVAETTKGHGKSPSARKLIALLTLLGAAPAFAESSISPDTLPDYSDTAYGSTTHTINGNEYNIKNHTNLSIDNFRSFSVGSDGKVSIEQLSGSSLYFARVTGTSPSVIAGSVSSNGKFMLINQNGIAITSTGRVDTASFIATTADIANADLINGNFSFSIAGKPDAEISNAGVITVADQGLAALVAPKVRNSGIIKAKLGRIELANAETFTVDFHGDGLLRYGLPAHAQSLIENTGELLASGGIIKMSASSVGGIVEGLISNTGVIRANSVTQEADGSIVLGHVDISADKIEMAGSVDISGEQGGNVKLIGNDLTKVSGIISAQGNSGDGGNIDITADKVHITSTANIDASGENGGRIRVGGEYQGGKDLDQDELKNAKRVVIEDGATLRAEANSAHGKGGTIINWANEVLYSGANYFARPGTESGTGGFVEVSAGNYLGFNGYAETGRDERHGALLFDPTNITISNAGSDLSTLCSPASCTILDTDYVGTDLTISATSLVDLLDNPNNVTLQATGNINVNASIVVDNPVGNGGDLVLNAGTTVGSELSFTSGTTINLDGGAFTGTGYNIGTPHINDTGGLTIVAGAINLTANNYIKLLGSGASTEVNLTTVNNGNISLTAGGAGGDGIYISSLGVNAGSGTFSMESSANNLTLVTPSHWFTGGGVHASNNINAGKLDITSGGDLEISGTTFNIAKTSPTTGDASFTAHGIDADHSSSGYSTIYISDSTLDVAGNLSMTADNGTLQLQSMSAPVKANNFTAVAKDDITINNTNLYVYGGDITLTTTNADYGHITTYNSSLETRTIDRLSSAINSDGSVHFDAAGDATVSSFSGSIHNAGNFIIDADRDISIHLHDHINAFKRLELIAGRNISSGGYLTTKTLAEGGDITKDVVMTAGSLINISGEHSYLERNLQISAATIQLNSVDASDFIKADTIIADATGNLSNNGIDITTTGDATFDAGGNIVFHGNNTFGGKLTLDATDRGIVGQDGGTMLIAGSQSVNGAAGLVASASDALTIGATIHTSGVGGVALTHTGTSEVYLNNANIDTDGQAMVVNSTGNIKVNGTTLQDISSMDMTAQNSITFTASNVTVANDANLKAYGTDADHSAGGYTNQQVSTSTFNVGGKLDMLAQNGTLWFGEGSVANVNSFVATAKDSIDIGGYPTGGSAIYTYGGDITLTATGTDYGHINVYGSDLQTRTTDRLSSAINTDGTVHLDAAGDVNINSFYGSNLTAGNFIVDAGRHIDLGNPREIIDVVKNLEFTAGGDITSGATITTKIAAEGGNDSDVVMTAGGLINLSGKQSYLERNFQMTATTIQVDDVQVTDFIKADTIVADATGNISNNGIDITTTGDASFDAGGNIILRGDNIFGGKLTLDADLRLDGFGVPIPGQDGGSITIGGNQTVNDAAGLVATSSGAITSSSTITTSGDIVLTTTTTAGHVDLNNATINANGHSLIIDSAGTLNGDTAVQMKSTNLQNLNNLDVSSSDANGGIILDYITLDATNLSGSVSINSGGSLTMWHTHIDSVARHIDLQANNGNMSLGFGSTFAGGSLTAIASGAISSDGNINVTGNLDMTGGSISLTGSTYAAGQDTFLTSNVGNISVTNLDPTESLIVRAQNDATFSGTDITVKNTVDIGAGGNLTINPKLTAKTTADGGNGSDVLLRADGTITVKDIDAYDRHLIMRGFNPATPADMTLGAGTINLTGGSSRNINADGITAVADGNIAITTNITSTAAASFEAGGNISIGGSSTLNAAGQTVTLDAANSIYTSGNFTINGGTVNAYATDFTANYTFGALHNLSVNADFINIDVSNNIFIGRLSSLTSTADNGRIDLTAGAAIDIDASRSDNLLTTPRATITASGLGGDISLTSKSSAAPVLGYENTYPIRIFGSVTADDTITITGSSQTKARSHSTDALSSDSSSGYGQIQADHLVLRSYGATPAYHNLALGTDSGILTNNQINTLDAQGVGFVRYEQSGDFSVIGIDATTIGAGDSLLTSKNGMITLDQAVNTGSNNLYLRGNTIQNIDGNIIANNLFLLGLGKTYTLSNLNNDVSTLSATGSGVGKITYVDSNTLGTGVITSSDDISITAVNNTLTVGGAMIANGTGSDISLTGNNIALNAAVTASGDTITLTGSSSQNASGIMTMDNLLLLGGPTANHNLGTATNNVVNLAANAGIINYKDSNNFSVNSLSDTDGITAAGAVTLTSNTGTISLDKSINATGYAVTLSGNSTQATAGTDGRIMASSLNLQGGSSKNHTLTNANNDVATLSATGSGAGRITYVDSNALGTATIISSNDISITSTNNTLTVNGAMTANNFGSDISLTANNIALNAAVSASGDTITLTGNSSQNASGALTATNLVLLGAGASHALATANTNDVTYIAADTGSVNYKDTNTLQVYDFGIGPNSLRGVNTNGDITLTAGALNTGRHSDLNPLYNETPLIRSTDGNISLTSSGNIWIGHDSNVQADGNISMNAGTWFNVQSDITAGGDVNLSTTLGSGWQIWIDRRINNGGGSYTSIGGVDITAGGNNGITIDANGYVYLANGSSTNTLTTTSADGDIILKSRTSSLEHRAEAVTQGDFTASSGTWLSVNNGGSVDAGGFVDFMAGSLLGFDGSPLIRSGGDMFLRAGSTMGIHGLPGAGNGVISGGKLTLESGLGSFDNTYSSVGQLTAAGDISITTHADTQTASNNEWVDIIGNVTSTSGKVTVNSASSINMFAATNFGNSTTPSISSQGDLTLNADSWIQADGATLTANNGNLTMTASGNHMGNFTVAMSIYDATLDSKGGNIILSGDGDSATFWSSGTYISNSTVGSVDTENITINGHATNGVGGYGVQMSDNSRLTTSATGSISITGSGYGGSDGVSIWQGMIEAGIGGLDINALAGDVYLGGDYAPNSALELQSGSTIEVKAANNVQLDGRILVNSPITLTANNDVLFGYELWDNASWHNEVQLANGSSLDVLAGRSIITAPYANIHADTNAVNIAMTADYAGVEVDPLLRGTGEATIKLMENSTIQTAGNVALTSGGNLLLQSNASVDSGGTLTTTSGTHTSIENAALVRSGGNMELNAGSTLWAYAQTGTDKGIVSGGTLSLSSGNNTATDTWTNVRNLTAVGDITITTHADSLPANNNEWVDLTGKITSTSGNITVDSASSVNIYTSGAYGVNSAPDIDAHGTLTMTAKEWMSLNSGTQVKSGGDMVLTALNSTLYVNAQSVQSGSNLFMTASNNWLHAQGSFDVAGNATLTSTTSNIGLEHLNFDAGGTITMNAATNIESRHDDNSFTAGDGINATAGSYMSIRGTMTANNSSDITLNANGNNMGNFTTALSIVDATLDSKGGDVILNGDGDSATLWSAGTYISNSTVGSVDAENITINGHATNGVGGYGVQMTNNSRLTTSATGSISITGSGYGASDGVSIWQGTLETGTGGLNITSLAGDVYLGGDYDFNPALSLSSTGNISIKSAKDIQFDGQVILNGATQAIANNDVLFGYAAYDDASWHNEVQLANGGSLDVLAGRSIIAAPYANIHADTNAVNIAMTANYSGTEVNTALRDAGSGEIHFIGNSSVQTAGNLSLTLTGLNSDDIAIDGSLQADTLTLTGNSTQSVDGSITAANLNLQGAGATHHLTAGTNDIDKLAANTGSVSFKDTDGFGVNTVGTTTGITATGDIALESVTGTTNLDQAVSTNTTTGIVTLTGNTSQASAGKITADKLLLKGDGAVHALNTVANDVNILAAQADFGKVASVTFKDTDDLDVGRITVGATDYDGITTSGGISVETVAGTLGVSKDISAENGTVTLHGVAAMGGNNAGLSITANVSTTTSGNITLYGESDGNQHGVNLTGIAANIDSAAGLSVTGLAHGTGHGVNASGIGLLETNSGTLSINGTSLAGGNGVTLDGGTFRATGGNLTIYGDGSTGLQTSASTQIETVNSGDISVTGISHALGSHGINLTSLGGNLNSAGDVYMEGHAMNATGDGIHSDGGTISTANGLGTSTGKVTLIGTADGSGHGIYLDHTTVSSDAGTITLQGESKAGGKGIYFSPNSLVQIISNTSADIYLIADSMDLTGVGNIVQSVGGNLFLQTLNNATTIEIGGSGASLNLLDHWFSGNLVHNRVFADDFNSINIGTTSNTGGITVSADTTITDSTNIRQGSGDIAFNTELTLTAGNTLMLHTQGQGTQGAAGAIIADKLELLGSDGRYALNNTSHANQVGILAANTGSVDFVNADILTIGDVNASSGITANSGLTANGQVSISTMSGDLIVASNITTDNNTANAIVLNAGRSENAPKALGTDVGGDIKIVGLRDFNTGVGGRVTFYSGSIANTDLPAMVTAGSGRFRYGSDETTSSFTNPLGSGQYVIYREQPVITVSTNDDSLIYNGLAYSGGNGYSADLTTPAVNGDTLSLSGAPVYGGTSQGAVHVGGSPYSITLSGLSNDLGYAVDTIDGILNINKADLTVTANDASKSYGQTTVFSGSEFSSSGLQNGETIGAVDLTSAGAAGTASVAGGPYAIAVSNANGGTFIGSDYNITYVDGSLTVNKADLTVTANNASKTYGQTTVFNGSEFSSSGLQNGETIGSVDLASLGAVSTANVAGGPYVISVNNAAGGSFDAGNYNISYSNGQLTVNKADLTVTADDASKTYGQTVVFSGSEFTSSGLQNGETIGSVTLTSAGASSNAHVIGSSYAINASAATGGSFDINNYNISYNNGQLTVNKADLTVTADDATKTYGQVVVFDGTEFSSSGLQNGETIGAVTLTSAGAAGTANVAGGPYAITASNANGGTFISSDYNITYVDGNLNVNKASLSITSNDVNKSYGQTVVFDGTEFSSTGLQNSETIGTVDLASAGASSNAHVAGSPYAITASAATGGSFDINNYDVSYNNGQLTVNKADLTVTADDASKTYGQTTVFNGSEFTALGLQNGETIGSVDLASAGASSTASVAGGPYAITASNANGGTFISGDYNITYVDGALTVNKADLTVTADDASKTYGQTTAFSGSEFSSSGLQNGETIGSVTLTSAGATNNAHVIGSPYAINASAATGGSFDAGNYNISYNNGQLTVNKADLTVSADDASKTYGQTTVFNGSEFTALGLQNGETIGSVDLASTGAAGTANVASGPYAITASNANGGTFINGDYNITYVDGALTVNKADLTVIANNTNKQYGQSVTFSGTEFSSVGLQNGETIGSVNLTSLGADPAASANGSPYAIIASNAAGGTFAADNYNVTYQAGALVINADAAPPIPPEITNNPPIEVDAGRLLGFTIGTPMDPTRPLSKVEYESAEGKNANDWVSARVADTVVHDASEINGIMEFKSLDIDVTYLEYLAKLDKEQGKGN